MLMAYFRNRPPIRNARMSLQHQARLSLVAEVPSPQSDVARRQSTLLEGNSPIGQAMSTRTNSDPALYAPIRRRSLLAHGVATRSSYVEPDPPRSVPPKAELPQDMQNYYYNPSKPTSSPLSDLAMIAPNPAFATDGPRAETPTEFHYGHLGGFNGTLRITNGAASPTPSSHRRSTSLGAEEDYFEARNGAESSHRHNLSQRSNTNSVSADAVRSPWIVRSESPLRNSHDAQFKPLTIQTQMPQDSLFSASNFEEERKLFKRTESPTKAQELANEYMQDLALSPFSFETSPPLSPQFQATSKHTAMEDELFEPEPDTPLPSSDLENHMPRSFDSGYVGGEPSPPAEEVKKPREVAPKPLAKADSGYSSNVSLRSFKKDPSPAKEATLRPPKEPVSRVASSTYSVESEATATARDSTPAEEIPELPRRLPPPVPVKESSFKINGALRNNQPPPVPQLRRADQAYSAPPQSDAAAKASKNRPQQHNTLPIPNSSVREESPASSDTSPSSNSSSRWRPKLTKRESQQSQPRIQTDQVFTVQAIRSPSEAYRIPPPSVEARRRLGEREEAFPVQSFPNTIAGNVALRRLSIDTLGTIFSVGSMEASAEQNFARHQGDIPPMPPMPTIIQEPVQQAQPKDNRRNTFQAPARYPPEPASHGRQSFSPVSRERGPSPGQMANWGRRAMHSMLHDVPRPVQDFETHITSLENTSSSLGRSGYDAARPTLVDQRAKSMTAQLEADAAARFAASKQRNVSASSDASSVMRPRKSYDSIANGNPYASGSGPSTANNSRSSSSEYHPIVQNNARRSSYTDLSTLLSAPPTTSTPPIEKRSSRPPTSKSPPPVSMATRAQSISRKPVGQPQPTRQAPVPQVSRHVSPQISSNKKLPLSPLAQQHDPSTWGAPHERKTHERMKSQASLGTRKSFDSARTPTTYEVVTLEEYKKRTSGPSPRASIGDLARPPSSSTSPKANTKDKKIKREEELKRRKSGAVEEIPRIVYHAPTLRERKSLEVPRINVQSYGAPLPPPTQTQTQMQRKPMKNRLSQSQSQETLTLRDLQREELQARRPKSVQPTKQLRNEVEVKEKKGRWDAYTAIFGSGSGREGKENRASEAVSKERISRPRPVEELAYGTRVVK